MNHHFDTVRFLFLSTWVILILPIFHGNIYFILNFFETSSPFSHFLSLTTKVNFMNNQTENDTEELALPPTDLLQLLVGGSQWSLGGQVPFHDPPQHQFVSMVTWQTTSSVPLISVSSLRS